MVALSTKRVMAAVILAGLGALATKVVTQSWDYWFAPFPLEVDVFQRTPAGTLVPAGDAWVDLHIPAVDRKKTDERGKALWKDLEPHPLTKMSIEATVPGYKMVAIGPSIPIRRRWGAVTVDMEAIPPAVEHASPSQPAPVPAPDISTVVRSGPQPSGPGKQFGNWTTLCSTDTDVPPNYEIKSVRFELAGDRQCNAWSECRESSKTPRRVCWDFRMQGHDEWAGPFGGLIPSGKSGVALSEGVLTATWGDAPRH